MYVYWYVCMCVGLYVCMFVCGYLVAKIHRNAVECELYAQHNCAAFSRLASRFDDDSILQP